MRSTGSPETWVAHDELIPCLHAAGTHSEHIDARRQGSQRFGKLEFHGLSSQYSSAGAWAIVPVPVYDF